MNAYQKLRIIRQLACQTQTEFGEAVGLSKGTISNLEKEKVPFPPYLVILLKLLYNVDSEWLMDDSQEDMGKRFYDKSMQDDRINPALIDKLNALNDTHKKIVLEFITTLYEDQQSKKIS